MEASPTQKYLTREEASDYVREKFGVRVAKTTLAKYATVGGGPPYRRWGRDALYITQDLDAWVERKLSARRKSSSPKWPDDEE